MKMPLAIAVAFFLVAVAPAKPLVLSNEDIGEGYEERPAELRAITSWLGLFVSEDKGSNGSGESRLAAARVRFVKSREPGGGWKLETSPPNAALLVSGVRGISPGPAITAAQSVDLWHEEPQAQIKVAERLYKIELVTQDPTYCDAVVSLALGTVTQKLFDMANLPTDWSCDDPHFKIHWAGDLDRDGKLDMLVTFSQKYSYFPRQLLLSTAARGPDLVAEVARYERFSQ